MRLEGRQREVADFDRVVDQFVVVGGDIACRSRSARRRARGSAVATRQVCAAASPAGARMSTSCGACSWPGHAQEHAGAVEEAVGLVEMGGAHRQVPRIDLVAQRSAGRRSGAACQLVLVDLCQRDRRPFDVAADAHDVAREFADHVAARDPGRQHEHAGRRAPALSTVSVISNRWAAGSLGTML